MVGLALVLEDDRTQLLDALITAPARSRLRHLRIEGAWLERADLEVLVAAPIAAGLACFHASLTGVTDSIGEDYISFSRINDDGVAAIALADIHPYLAPTVEDLRKEQRRNDAELDARMEEMKKEIEKRAKRARTEKREEEDAPAKRKPREPWFRRWFRK